MDNILPSGLLRTTFQTLRLDAVAVEIIAILTANSIPVVLVKGPATVHYLYADDPHTRSYRDIDLVVAPADFVSTQQCLAAHGCGLDRGDLHPAESAITLEVPLTHERSGAAIDVHQGFHGVQDWNAWWDMLSTTAVDFSIADALVRIPDAPATALIVALHNAVQTRSSREDDDLERALNIFDHATWVEAVARADALGCRSAFVDGIARHKSGPDLLERLDLDVPASLVGALERSALTDESLSLRYGLHVVHRLQRTEGSGRRLRQAFHLVFPSADELRYRYPVAKRGRAGLVAARVYRPLKFLVYAPRVAVTLLKAARASRHS
ncbi:nucleotidyltransferase family protein [Smaragdicoccus niigatensis]